MIRADALTSAVAAVLVSCGTVQLDSLAELRELTADTRATKAKQESPVSWSEGERYLSMAQKALESGDENQAERLAGLGVIQIKLALVGAEQSMARNRLEAEMENKRLLGEELERTASEVETLETDRERRMIRKHITNVVDAARRRAAAAEELYESKLSGEEKKQMNGARRQIGQEMLARIVVWRDILTALTQAGVFPADGASAVDREIKAAEQKLMELDLVELQRHIENAGMETRRLLDEVWDGKERDRDSRIAQIARNLSDAGFGLVQEEFGPVISIEAPFSTKGKGDKRWSELFGGLGVKLQEIGRIKLLILGSVDANRAKKAAESIAGSGFPKGDIAVRACGSTFPLKALKDAKNGVAVLLVLLP